MVKPLVRSVVLWLGRNCALFTFHVMLSLNLVAPFADWR